MDKSDVCKDLRGLLECRLEREALLKLVRAYS